MNRYKYLDGYEFSGCAVRRRSIISFFGTKWEGKDALETRVTAAFIYYPAKPEEKRWAYAEMGLSTGIHGAAAYRPDERWVFLMDDGAIFSIGGGSAGPEKPVTKEKNAFFRNIRAINNEYTHAVGTSRRVFRREAKDKWIKLDHGLPPDAHGGDLGFDDIDGFSDTEIYACGGKGDLWTFDGGTWSRIDLPTNAALERICCGGDGLVYILTDQKSFLVGRAQSWTILEQDVTQKVLEEMVWYNDRIYVSSGDALFQIANGVFEPCPVPPPQRSCVHLASGDGILVVAGGNEACMFDGTGWTTILAPP
jgi:hypothetical protein